jgi:hypothetical protein
MAKKSSVNRNSKRELMAKRDLGKRTRLKDVVMDRTVPVEERFAPALHADRPSARQLSQVQAVPHSTTRIGQLGSDPGHGQGQLVR